MSSPISTATDVKAGLSHPAIVPAARTPAAQDLSLPHRRNRPARLPPQHGHHPAQLDHLGAVRCPRLSYPLNDVAPFG